MKSLSDQVVHIAAAGVLVAGGAYAGRIYLSQPRYVGPSTQRILATSQRLHGELPKVPVPGAIPVTTRVAFAPVSRRKKPIGHVGPLPIVTIKEVTAPKKPMPTPVPKPDPTPATRTPAAPPGSNLALTGIAGRVNDREAMFFNLDDGERASGKQGDSVFGFTIAAVYDDAVDLMQGQTPVTLRMGEKSAAVRAMLARSIASAETLTTGTTSPGVSPLVAQVSASETRSSDGRSPSPTTGVQTESQAGRGDRDGGDRRGASTTRGGPRRYSEVANSSRRYSTVRTYASNRNRGLVGLRLSGFGASRWGGRGYRRVLEPTPNPQAARRTGAPLTGDTAAITEPETLSNPQTERRMRAYRAGNRRGAGF